MANNGMYLVCRSCKSNFLLGQTLSSNYFTWGDNFEKQLNEFYNDHAHCGIDSNVNNENQFELRYESAFDKGIKTLE